MLRKNYSRIIRFGFNIWRCYIYCIASKIHFTGSSSEKIVYANNLSFIRHCQKFTKSANLLDIRLFYDIKSSFETIIF